MIYDVAGLYLEPGSQSSHQFESAPEEPNLVAQSFYDLLRLEDQELYPGCDFASLLNTTARLLNIKTSSNVSQATFDQFVAVLKSVLPKDNKLPGSFYEAKKLTKKLGMRMEKIHVCPKECMLFYKEHSHLNACLHCGASRYLPGMEPGHRKKGVGAKFYGIFLLFQDYKDYSCRERLLNICLGMD